MMDCWEAPRVCELGVQEALPPKVCHLLRQPHDIELPCKFLEQASEATNAGLFE